MCQVEQLEGMSSRVCQLEADLRGVLDEKQELVTERESYLCKLARLNHQLNVLLKSDTSRLIDIDAIVMDNKYLQEQIQQLQAEKELSHQALLKYKSIFLEEQSQVKKVKKSQELKQSAHLVLSRLPIRLFLKAILDTEFLFEVLPQQRILKGLIIAKKSSKNYGLFKTP
ncbi:hypothetical protein J6590_079486 [Homalodisca vitripennis]|nr:hypothetical protein J6590_079486 [Homalodisca vitripennis]